MSIDVAGSLLTRFCTNASRYPECSSLRDQTVHILFVAQTRRRVEVYKQIQHNQRPDLAQRSQPERSSSLVVAATMTRRVLREKESMLDRDFNQRPDPIEELSFEGRSPPYAEEHPRCHPHFLIGVGTFHNLIICFETVWTSIKTRGAACPFLN